MANKFLLKIVTSEKEVFSEEVISFNTSTKIGKKEFLNNHTSAIMTSVPALSYITRGEGDKVAIFINKGLLNFDNRKNELIVCADEALFKEDIDLENLLLEKENLEKILEDKNNRKYEKAKLKLPVVLMKIGFAEGK